jgi:hypothetical protein
MNLGLCPRVPQHSPLIGVPDPIQKCQQLLITEMITRFKLITPGASECWHLCFLSSYKVTSYML